MEMTKFYAFRVEMTKVYVLATSIREPTRNRKNGRRTWYKKIIKLI